MFCISLEEIHLPGLPVLWFLVNFNNGRCWWQVGGEGEGMVSYMPPFFALGTISNSCFINSAVPNPTGQSCLPGGATGLWTLSFYLSHLGL
jgi:hypothetical protein